MGKTKSELTIPVAFNGFKPALPGKTAQNRLAADPVLRFKPALTGKTEAFPRPPGKPHRFKLALTGKTVRKR